VRALVIVHEPSAYAPTRVRDAANYLLTSSGATEDEQRLANEAIEWLRSKRDKPMGRKTSKRGEAEHLPGGSQYD